MALPSNGRYVQQDWSWIANLGQQVGQIIQSVPAAVKYSRKLASYEVTNKDIAKGVEAHINAMPQEAIDILGVSKRTLLEKAPQPKKNEDPREFSARYVAWYQPIIKKLESGGVGPDVVQSWLPKAPDRVDLSGDKRIAESVTAMKKLDEQNRISKTTEAATRGELTMTPMTNGNVGSDGKPVIELGTTGAPQTREQFQGRFAEMSKPSTGGERPGAPGIVAPSRPGLRPETTQAAVENNPQFAATQAGLPTQAAVAGERYKTATLTERAADRNARVETARLNRAAANTRAKQAYANSTKKVVFGTLSKEASTLDAEIDRSQRKIAALEVKKEKELLNDPAIGAKVEGELQIERAIADRLATKADNLAAVAEYLASDPFVRENIDAEEMHSLKMAAYAAAADGTPFDVAAVAAGMVPAGAPGRTPTPVPTAEKKDGLGIRGLLGK